jgi:nitroreductase
VSIDTGRNVGALDPYLREEHIGVGCALENLMLAAAANGYQASTTLYPGKLEPIPSGSGPQLLARVDLAAGTRLQSELYDAIPRRHTNRGPFLPQNSIPVPFIDALGRLPGDNPEVRIFLFTADADRKKVAEISSAANREIYVDPEVIRGTQRWMRTRWSAVEKYRDGLTIDASGQPPIAIDIAKMMPLRMLKWAASRGPKNGYSDLMLSAPLIGIVAVRDRYDRQDCMRAGRIWQRAHLLATARGLAARPCNEAVEMIDYERAHDRPPLRAGMLAEVLGDTSWQPTFVFYMGFPTLTARTSPRRPIEDVVV